MKLTSSHPFWSVNKASRRITLHYNTMCSRDAVIIGGGITEALVAVHLAEAGVKTLVLDKRDIGTGSTSASTGLLQYEIDPPARVEKKVGLVAATRSYQLCRGVIGKLEQLAARRKTDCGFERKPSLFLARNQREKPELREEFQLRRKRLISSRIQHFGQLEIIHRNPHLPKEWISHRIPNRCRRRVGLEETLSLWRFHYMLRPDESFYLPQPFPPIHLTPRY